MTYPPSIPYDISGEIVDDMVANEDAEATYIDEALAAISQGDRASAMALLEDVARARAIRASRARPARRTIRRRAQHRELVEA